MYLQIKQLNKSYGTRHVISNVDLAMEEGEILSLLGPSGCGKTTILRMIAGLIRPDSGWIQVGNRVLFDGKREMPVEERDLGMVFQDYALWPHMTVAGNIAFGMRLHRKPAREIKKRVAELLELVNLSGYGNRYPYQMSGGQQQRVAVARALATEPRVVLLDEPLSSLDAALRETMGTELVELFKRLKITAINVTHDQNEAMMMSDRIMVLHDGYVQQVGTPTDLYQRPANAFVASFMGAANMFPGEFLRDESQTAVRSEHVAQEKAILVGTVDESVCDNFKGRASLLCRPDDVHIHIDRQAINVNDSAINLLTGTVMHSSFVGGRWRTLVNVGEGEKHIVLAFAHEPISIEQRVWVELPPERCRIVPV
jgi:ABC-type Fe3+/spermidine/putrescine transport system ATPase subunit